MSCSSTTKKGNKCTRGVKEGFQYCWQHSTAVEQELKNEDPFGILPLQNTDSNKPRYVSGTGTIFDGIYTTEINKNMIKIVLFEVHPDTGINTEALELVAEITYSLYNKLPEAKTVEEFKNEILKFYQGQLGKHALSEITKEAVKMSQFNPTEIQKLHKVRITAIEYLIAEILELAGNATRDTSRGKHRNINYEDIQLTISLDNELYNLINREFPNTILPQQYLLHRCLPDKSLSLKGLKAIFDATNIKLTGNTLGLIHRYFYHQITVYKKDELEECGVLNIFDYVNKWITEIGVIPKSYKDVTQLILRRNIIQESQTLRKNQYLKLLDDLQFPKDLIINILAEYI